MLEGAAAGDEGAQTTNTLLVLKDVLSFPF